jgi:hypothetical protein
MERQDAAMKLDQRRDREAHVREVARAESHNQH